MSEYEPQTLIGQFLYEEMKLQKMSVRSFAEKLGVSRDTLNRLLRSKNQPDLDVLIRLSGALDINLITLIILSRPEDATALVEQCQHPRLISRSMQVLNIPPIVEKAIQVMAKDTQREEEIQEIREAATVLNASAFLLATGAGDDEVLTRHTENTNELVRIVAAKVS